MRPHHGAPTVHNNATSNLPNKFSQTGQKPGVLPRLVFSPMRFVAHPADTFNIFRALLAPVVFFLPFGCDFFADHIFVYFIALLFLIGNTNYILHLHIHRPFTTLGGFNLLLDLAMGASTGMTASNWRIQHLLGHHKGDEQRYRARPNGELERYTVLNAISYSLLSIWPTFFLPIAEAFDKGVLARVKSPIDFRWAFAEQCLLLALVAALGLWRPALVVCYVLPWYALNFFMTRYVDYLNHYGCDESGANQLECANNSLSPWFNKLTNNFGYHTAHHFQPNAHWTELPRFHRAIADRIPQHCLKPYSWSCALMLYHFYLSSRGRM